MAVPLQALERFRILSSRADEHSILVRELYDQAAFTRAELQRLKAAFRHPQTGAQLEVGEGGEVLTTNRLGQPVEVDDAGLRQLAGHIRQFEGELAHLQARIKETGERGAIFRTLADTAKRTLLEHGAPGVDPVDFVPMLSPGRAA
jgi:hypothetical protein